MEITPLRPFGFSVRGLDVRCKHQIKILRQLLDQYAFVLLPSGSASPNGPPLHENRTLAELASVFGNVQGSHSLNNANISGVQEIVTKGDSVVGQNAQVKHADKTWHDSPSLSVVLSVKVVSLSGGDTTLYDSHQLYNVLPDELRSKLRNMSAVHTFETTYVRTRTQISLRKELKDSPAQFILLSSLTLEPVAR